VAGSSAATSRRRLDVLSTGEMRLASFIRTETPSCMNKSENQSETDQHSPVSGGPHRLVERWISTRTHTWVSPC
jgi:hypothetical protein